MGCNQRSDEELFISQIDLLEDNPELALTQMDTTHLEQIQTFQQATHYLTKSLAEHYIRNENWPNEERMQQCLRLFRKHQAYEPLLESLCLLSNMYENKKQKDKQIAYIEEAIALARKQNDYAWLFFLYDNLSNMYLKQYNTIKYYQYQALANQCIKDKDIRAFNVSSQIFIGRNYLYTNKNKEAIAVLKSIEDTLASNHIYYAECKLLLGIAYIKEKQREKAIEKLVIAVDKSKKDSNTALAAIILTNLYYKAGDKVKAVSMQKKIDIDRLLPSDYRLKKEFYKISAQMAYDEKKYSEAFDYMQRIQSLNQQIITQLNTKTLDEVILDNKIKNDQQAKSTYERKLYMLVGALVLSICCLIGFFLSKKKKFEKRKWELDQRLEVLQRINDESKSVKNELIKFIVRDFEIAKRIALLKNSENDSNQAFIKKLDKLFVTEENQLLQLEWSNFYTHVNLYKQNFHQKLLEAYPMLSEKEVQLCCLLIVGFNTHEIAAIWAQSIHSVHKYKTSIRKKIALSERADIPVALTTRFGLPT